MQTDVPHARREAGIADSRLVDRAKCGTLSIEGFYEPPYAGVGMGLGICFGAALGAAMHNVGVGVAFGVAMGVAFGLIFGGAA